MSNVDRIQVNRTTIIEYPPEWRDHTGPFGGAFNWALKNLKPHEEVIGVRYAQNRYGRTEIFKFRLIMGPNNEVRGKMETEDNRSYTIRGGYMGLVHRGDEWIKRWVLAASDYADGQCYWHFEWEREIVRNEAPTPPPAMAMALVSQCSEMLHELTQPLSRNWCREVFGCTFKQLPTSHMRKLVEGMANHRHHELHRYVSEVARPLHPNRGLEFSHESMDELVSRSRTLLGLANLRSEVA